MFSLFRVCLIGSNNKSSVSVVSVVAPSLSKSLFSKHSTKKIKLIMMTSKSKMKDTTKILNDLRQSMKNLPNGIISAYIIPSDDEHQSEYICQHDERRHFITGFTGSAGTAVVTEKEALLWTDGRYYQQAAQQLDTNWILMKDDLPTTPTIGGWLATNIAKGDVIGVDGRLMDSDRYNTLYSQLEVNENTIISVAENLIDAIWTDQPARTSNKIIKLDCSITGQTIGDKLTNIREKMKNKLANVLVITALDEVAWFLNLRGNDIDFNPVFFAYVIVTLDDIYLFVDQSKLPDNYEDHFETNSVKIKIDAYQNVSKVLKDLANYTTSKVWISASSSYALNSLIPNKKRHQEITPIATMKAIKNDVEANGMEQSHIRDGVALCQYFAWLEKTVQAGEQIVTEISGATKLEEFRKKQDKFMGLSFPTINGSGPNGAVIHYHPEESTNRPITTNEMYLCDSGAQYMDGTTDVTRTWHFGTPTAHQIDCYTRVLKGQISLGTQIFPKKIKGQVLDTLARKSLWDVGLDYRHGTGHGIGHFLNVHEGPMGIHLRAMPDDPGLQENMFLSNEPGYYEEGEFGIRIEDIVRIVPANIKNNFNGRGALTFKTITMCPIQTKLIDVELLTEKERSHLNSYHQIVLNTLSPFLIKINDQDTLSWLTKETKAVRITQY